MRMRTVTKSWTGLGVIVAVIFGVLLFGHRSVTYSLEPLQLPGSQVRLWVDLKPTHPFLSEYDRVLTVTRGNLTTQQPLFPDTGGYGRLNIYIQSADKAIVKGPFEEFLIHVDTLQIEKLSKPVEHPGKYLAAFAKAPEGVWRFIPATEAAEQSVARPQ